MKVIVEVWLQEARLSLNITVEVWLREAITKGDCGGLAERV